MWTLLARYVALGSLVLPPARASPQEVRLQPPEDAEDDDASSVVGGAEIDTSSRFVWRGLALSNGPVVHPSAWVSASDVTATVWSNVMLAREQPRASVVSSLGKDFTWDALSVTPSALVVAATHSDPQSSTAEASLALSLSLGSLRLVGDHALDVGGHPGAYFGTFGVAWQQTDAPWTLGARVDLAFANAVFHHAFFGVDRAGPSSVAGEISLRAALEGDSYVLLHAQVSSVLSRRLRAAVDEPTLACAGVAFGVEL